MGQTTDTSTTSTDTPGDNDAASTGDEALGAAGMKALQAERQARTEAERREREAVAKLRERELADERREVAASKGLTEAQAAYLTGDNRAALETAADGLLAAFGPAPATTPTTGGRSRPREALRGGASAGDDDSTDVGKIADQVLSN